MKLYIEGNVNLYYVQMLCMTFFPGAKFSEDEEITPDTPILNLLVVDRPEGIEAKAKLTYKDKSAQCERYYERREGITDDKLKKMVIGDAIVAAGGELLGYRPSWGMLIGVRPSKVATDLLVAGNSKTKVKKILASEYFVIPKKAALATEVALHEARLIGDPQKKDCSVYISIPFCPSRCSYCSFVSYTSKKLLDKIPEYIVRLNEEIVSTFEYINRNGFNVKTVYIGGGTPTILDELQLRSVLSTLASCTDVSKLEEYTLEAGRPDTINAEKLRIAHEYGVTRVSVNPQTLNEEVLEKIGRRHSTEDFLRAYDIARNSPIKIINTDMIAGLPGDKFATFSASFDKILALRPENITVHTFSVKKACDALRRDSGIYSMRGGDVGKSVDYSQIKAQHEGYNPYYMYRQKNTVGNYENVGFALDDCEGLYNIYMMEEVHSIFAMGAGAVSKFVDYCGEGGKRSISRFFNQKYPYEYLNENKCADKLHAADDFFTRYGIIEKFE